MKSSGPALRRKLLTDIQNLLLADPSVMILWPLESCLSSGTVPLSLMLPDGQVLKISLLARQEPVNFRIHHGQEQILSLEHLANLERPQSCTSLLHLVAWLKENLYKQQILLLGLVSRKVHYGYNKRKQRI
jgi:hypothetical protein